MKKRQQFRTNRKIFRKVPKKNLLNRPKRHTEDHLKEGVLNLTTFKKLIFEISEK